MKQKLISLARRYVAALRKHLSHASSTSLESALGLGHGAVSLGLDTLDLTHIHERALAALNPPAFDRDAQKQARAFLIKANSPINQKHRTAQQSEAGLKRLKIMLVERTAELAISNRKLQLGIAQRKHIEASLQKSGVHYTKLLQESLELQEGLRQLTHRVLAAQEDERKHISRKLQHEIAQTLLGINVRLHSLKLEARKNTKGIKQEIASTQLLVTKSIRSMREVARKYGGL